MNKSSLLAIALTALALPVQAIEKPVPKASGKTIECMTLEQNCSMGPMLMRISKDALRLEMDKMSIHWLARGPKWDSHAFNPESKMMVTREYDDWRENLIKMPSGGRKRTPESLTLKPTGQIEDIAGFKCRKIAIYRKPGQQIPGQVRKSEPKEPYVVGHVWVSDTFPAPKQVAEVIKQLTKVDVKTGIVLKATTLKPESFKEFRPIFETLSIKKDKVPSSLFDPPQGYRAVASEIDLMMGPDEVEDDYKPVK